MLEVVRLKHVAWLLQVDFHHSHMPKRQNKKAQVDEEEPEVEVITKLEIIYEDTKATTGVEPDYKWG